MSKFKKEAGKAKSAMSGGYTAPAKVAVGVSSTAAHRSKPVVNFMGANSFTLDPLATLKLIAASSIFGEPQYYRGANKAAETFEKAIDAALDYDFVGTLTFAIELRRDYWMRFNPQIIVVRAAVHPGRVAFTSENPGLFKLAVEGVTLRPDDITNQLEYYLAKFEDRKAGKGKKASRLPNVLKRAQADRLASFGAYHIGKYAKKGIGLIDVVRLLNTRWLREANATINELMSTGTVAVEEDNKTWRALKSAGKKWPEILNSGITITHSDYLFQLRTILSELPSNDYATADKVVKSFLGGVAKGRLFPYQYWMAYKTLESDTFAHKQKALDALNEAISLSIKAQPKLEGKVATLVDNSGSARSGVMVEGTNRNIYEVGNLSGVMTALNADEGVIGVFGDSLEMVPVRKSESVVSQVKKINDIGEGIGGGTENGIWLFWRNAIRNREHYDHVFIYSDQQAGTGGLYGVNPAEYRQYAAGSGGRYIDVWKLIDEYRKIVNPKVNVFSVQIAGYDNSVLPENRYRGANLTGWTGKEVAYAQAIINLWNQIEQSQ